jgi:NAD/NADP transhydrogenase beta subunit
MAPHLSMFLTAHLNVGNSGLSKVPGSVKDIALSRTFHDCLQNPKSILPVGCVIQMIGSTAFGPLLTRKISYTRIPQLTAILTLTLMAGTALLIISFYVARMVLESPDNAMPIWSVSLHMDIHIRHAMRRH